MIREMNEMITMTDGRTFSTKVMPKLKRNSCARPETTFSTSRTSGRKAAIFATAFFRYSFSY